MIFKSYSGSLNMEIVASILNHNLVPLDTVVREFPLTPPLVYVDKSIKAVHAFPNARNIVPVTLLSFGPAGFLYEMRTNSLHIRVYNQSGKEIREKAYKHMPLLLTHNDIDSLALSIPIKSRGFFYKALKQNKVTVPGHWQTVQNLLVDDKGRCWIELVNPGNLEQTWWVFDTDGNPKWKFKLSSEVQPCVVRNEEVYGVWRKKGEYPRIVRYHVEGMKE